MRSAKQVSRGPRSLPEGWLEIKLLLTVIISWQKEFNALIAGRALDIWSQQAAGTRQNPEHLKDTKRIV